MQGTKNDDAFPTSTITATETSNLLKVDSYPRFIPLSERYYSSPSFGTIESSSTTTTNFIPLKHHTARSLSFRGGGGTPTGVITNSNIHITLEAWIIPALTCALSYALYNISIKKASNDINPVLGGVILQFVAAMLGLFIYIGERQVLFMDGNDDNGVKINHDLKMVGIYWSIAAGIFVGIAEILSFTVNGKGVPATQSIPVIIGGSVFFGTVLGKLFLHESISYRGWIGVFFITLGIAFVSMESGGVDGGGGVKQ